MTTPPNDRSPAGEAVHHTRRQADMARRRARRGFGPAILAQRLGGLAQGRFGTRTPRRA